MDYLFYILYTGYREAALKSSEAVKDNVKFSVCSIFTFYILLLTIISIVTLARYFFPELGSIPLQVVMFIAVFGTIFSSFTILNRHYSTARIKQLNEKYANTISSKKAVIIYWVCLLSIPIVTISLAISVTK